jgi:hypothetical protein
MTIKAGTSFSSVTLKPSSKMSLYFSTTSPVTERLMILLTKFPLHLAVRKDAQVLLNSVDEHNDTLAGLQDLRGRA